MPIKKTRNPWKYAFFGLLLLCFSGLFIFLIRQNRLGNLPSTVPSIKRSDQLLKDVEERHTVADFGDLATQPTCQPVSPWSVLCSKDKDCYYDSSIKCPKIGRVADGGPLQCINFRCGQKGPFGPMLVPTGTRVK